MARCVLAYPASQRMPDARRTEVDVLGVVLVFDARGQQPHDMHAREAAPAGQLAHGLAVADVLRDMAEQFLDHMAQTMGLHLAGDVAGYAARVLDVLLAMRDLPHRLRLWPDGIPHVDGEDQRVAARVVVEDDLGRRVGENAAVPIELAIDADGRERRRQCARGQDVLDADLDFAAVEVAHLARAHVRGADRKPGLAAIDEREIDQLQQRLFERSGRVVSGSIRAQHHVISPERQWIGFEETGDAAGHRVQAGQCLRKLRPGGRAVPELLERHAIPEFLQLGQAVVRGSLPAIRLALMAPIEVPMIQSGSMPASCRA